MASSKDGNNSNPHSAGTGVQMSYRMTERRFAKVEPILEEYREKWVSSGFCDVRSFEIELKKALETGYKEIESALQDLLENQRYALLVLYYYQNHNAPGVPHGLKPHLANAYGVASYDNQATKELRESFWSRFSTPESRERGLNADD